MLVLPTDSLRERMGRLLREHGQAAGRRSRTRVDTDDHELRRALQLLHGAAANDVLSAGGCGVERALLVVKDGSDLRDAINADAAIHRGFMMRAIDAV